MLGIGGAMILTFYKGIELQPWNTNINLLETTSTHHHPSGLPSQNEHGGYGYVLGAALALASCLFYSLWLIVQAKAGEEYPCPYSITAMMAASASIQCVALALCVERDWSQWNLGWDIRLFTVALSGVLGSGMMFTLVAWCVRTRGPLFVSIFQPLMLVMVALGGSLFLEEKLHLGIVIGGILIVSGLYMVLWGQRKEIKAHELTQTTEENEARIDIPPPPLPVVQSGSSHRNSSGRGAEAEERIDLPLAHRNNIIHSRSCSGNSCTSSSRVEAEGQIDSPLQTQNDSVHSSNSSGGGNGTMVEEEEEEQVEGHYEEFKEMEETERAQMQPQLEALFPSASGPSTPPPPPPPPPPPRPSS